MLPSVSWNERPMTAVITAEVATMPVMSTSFERVPKPTTIYVSASKRSRMMRGGFSRKASRKTSKTKTLPTLTNEIQSRNRAAQLTHLYDDFAGFTPDEASTAAVNSPTTASASNRTALRIRVRSAGRTIERTSAATTNIRSDHAKIDAPISAAAVSCCQKLIFVQELSRNVRRRLSAPNSNMLVSY